jgi:hypothetical protein
VADAYDVLGFAIRGHNAVRARLQRAAEALCKGEPTETPIEALLEEFNLAHQRLMIALERVAEQGPAPPPLIPQPQSMMLR